MNKTPELFGLWDALEKRGMFEAIDQTVGRRANEGRKEIPKPPEFPTVEGPIGDEGYKYEGDEWFNRGQEEGGAQDWLKEQQRYLGRMADEAGGVDRLGIGLEEYARGILSLKENPYLTFRKMMTQAKGKDYSYENANAPLNFFDVVTRDTRPYGKTGMSRYQAASQYFSTHEDEDFIPRDALVTLYKTYGPKKAEVIINAMQQMLTEDRRYMHKLVTRPMNAPIHSKTEVFQGEGVSPEEMRRWNEEQRRRAYAVAQDMEDNPNLWGTSSFMRNRIHFHSGGPRKGMGVIPGVDPKISNYNAVNNVSRREIFLGKDVENPLVLFHEFAHGRGGKGWDMYQIRVLLDRIKRMQQRGDMKEGKVPRTSQTQHEFLEELKATLTGAHLAWLRKALPREEYPSERMIFNNMFSPLAYGATRAQELLRIYLSQLNQGKDIW